MAYAGDSSLFYESNTRSLDVVDPQGKFIRVMALPRPQDFNALGNTGSAGVDGRGHLYYQGRRPLNVPRPCGATALPPRLAAAPPSMGDSVPIIRGDFEKRTVDTIGRVKVVVSGMSFPTTTTDANCTITSAKVRMDPSVPPADAWVMTSTGSIAIVRSHDYHIDWIDPDGTQRSTAKLPFDWRRFTDAEKQAKIDSAKRIVDSLTAAGGYRLKSCGGGQSIEFDAEPPSANGSGDVMIMGGSGGGRGLGSVGAGRGGGGDAPPPGRDPTVCQTVTVTAVFAPLDSMADYLTPIRESSARADLDGNVWVLPTTSASAKGGLLYDVINSRGELIERVQLPGGRDIAGFGHNGVLYLSHGDWKTGYVIERVRVLR
jgi:hypothetical protein